MNMRRYSVLLVMFLVVSLPMVQAVVINGYGYGGDERSNLIRSEDDLTLKVQVLGEDPDESYVTYRPLGGLPINFDTCGSEFCLLTLDEQTFESRSYSYDVRYDSQYDTENIRVKVYPDVLGARINDLGANRYVLRLQDSITFAIDVSDTACSTSDCAGKCSGIKKINIYEGSLNNLVGQIDVYSESCQIEDIRSTMMIEDLVDGEGTYTLIFEAVDEFENPARNTKSMVIKVDDSPPAFSGSGFSLWKNGREIEEISGQINDVELSFNLDESAQSVRADLSSLNPSLGIVDIDCNDYYCSEEIDLNLLVQSEGHITLAIDVELEDEIGNVGSYTIQKTVLVDRNGPQVLSATTDGARISGVLGLGPETKVSVIFDDLVGLDQNAWAYIDFSAVSPGSTRVKAEECHDNVCTFPVIAIQNEGIKTLRVRTDTMDDLGNGMASSYSFDVNADSSINSIIDIPYVGFEETDFDATGSYPTRGDTLTVIAVLQEDTDVFAYGNFSAIVDDGYIEADCEGGYVNDDGGSSSNDGLFERFSPTDALLNIHAEDVVCTWEVEVERSGSIIDKTVTLFFEDSLNNKITETVVIPNIYAIENEETPNYWEHRIDCSPKLLDRTLGELIEQKMYCSLELIPLTDLTQNIVNIELDDCDSDYLTDSQLGNEYTTYPYLSFRFDKDEYETNEVNVECSLEVSSQIGTKVISNPEVEMINLSIGLFNNPFGRPDDSIVSEIEDIKETWGEGLGSLIRWLNIIVKFSERICRVMGTWQELKQVSGFTAMAVPDPKGTVYRTGVDRAAVVPAEVNRGFAYKFCSWVNCRPLKEATGEDDQWSFGGGSGYGDLTFGYDEIISATGGDYLYNMGVPSEHYMEISNNWLASTMTFCIPGMIKGLEKYRQIQCFYGYCLQDLTVDAGIPPYICQQQKEYMTCKFFLTPVFKLVPWVNFFDNMVNIVKESLSDPFAVIGVVFNFMCPSYDQSGWSGCRLVHLVNVALDAYSDISGIMGEFKGFKEDYCEELGSSSRSSGSGRGYVR